MEISESRPENLEQMWKDGLVTAVGGGADLHKSNVTVIDKRTGKPIACFEWDYDPEGRYDSKKGATQQ